MSDTTFEWNTAKEKLNIEKHGVSFSEAQHAFLDKNRVIVRMSHTVKLRNDIIVLGWLKAVF